VSTDILHFSARVVVTPADAFVKADASHRSRGVERHEGTADDHFHTDHSPPAARLRPPATEFSSSASGTGPSPRTSESSLDGAWVAYHVERNHQGVDNRLILPAVAPTPGHGRVVSRERLGGLLKYNNQPAA
jgi:hypothetical protein